MRAESEVWQALLRRKRLSVTDLAGQLGRHSPACASTAGGAQAGGVPTGGAPNMRSPSGRRLQGARCSRWASSTTAASWTSCRRGTPSRSSQAERWLRMSPAPRARLPACLRASSLACVRMAEPGRVPRSMGRGAGAAARSSLWTTATTGPRPWTRLVGEVRARSRRRR